MRGRRDGAGDDRRALELNRDPVRLHGQHLPLADRRGRDAPAGARTRASRTDRDRQRGHRRLARRRAAGPARDRGRAPARRHARGRRAPGPPRRLRALRPAGRDGPREPARPAGAIAPDEEAAEKVRLLREFDPAAGAATSTSPTRTTAATAASRTCSTWSRPPAAGCSTSCGPPRRCEPRGAVAAATGRAVRALRRVGGGDINDAYAAELEDGGRAFVKTRADAPPASTRPRPRPALARRADGAAACPRCSAC